MRSLRRYAGILSAASVPPIIEFSSRFARTIFLSHLLTPTDLGAAVALTTIATISELVTDVGLTQFVMMNFSADRAQAVAAARQFGIIRGCLLALLIVGLAPLLANLLGASKHVDSIRWLAVVPLVWSLRNWRTVQIQSEYRYRPEALSIGIAYVSSVIVIFPAVSWFHDERTMLASLIVEATLYVIVSHLVLPRQRVPAVDPAIRRAALAFGLPLMANGIGILLLTQADRIIVSNLFGLQVLALYSLAVGLAFVPISVFAVTVNKLLMIFIVRSRARPAEARQVSLITAWLTFLAAACYAVTVGAVLDLAVPMLYGQRYQVAVGLHALITLLVFLRLCRSGPTTILLAHGQTRHVTAANMVSGVGFLIGFILGFYFHRVEAVLLGILVGDVLSLAAMLKFAGPHLPMQSSLNHLALLSLSAALAGIGALAEPYFMLATRILVVIAGALVIGLDITIAHRRNLTKFP